MRLDAHLRARIDASIDSELLDDVVAARAHLAAALLLRPALVRVDVARAIGTLLGAASGDELAALDRALRSASTLRALGDVDATPDVVDAALDLTARFDAHAAVGPLVI